jgi:hypothetical protein
LLAKYSRVPPEHHRISNCRKTGQGLSIQKRPVYLGFQEFCLFGFAAFCAEMARSHIVDLEVTGSIPVTRPKFPIIFAIVSAAWRRPA